MKYSTAPITSTESHLKKIDHLPVMGVLSPSPVLLTGRPLPLEKKSNRILKRVFDVVLSLILILVLFSWLLPLIAILIRMDSKGPVFFLQKRNKKHNLLFTCIKFRTMVPNQASDTMPACVNDSRITRLGKILRKYYLDELPQLLNVLMGDMSMIGPRPYMVSDNLKFNQVVEHYTLRHAVKPGITGPAQLLGYKGAINDTSRIAERVNMDFHYVHNWSISMDIKILFNTFLKTIQLK